MKKENNENVMKIEYCICDKCGNRHFKRKKR
jgi:hypothetical protein